VIHSTSTGILLANRRSDDGMRRRKDPDPRAPVRVFQVITATSSCGATVGDGVGVGVGVGVGADADGAGVGVGLVTGALQPARTARPPASNIRRSRPGMIRL
jgi:hypothetical protein